MGEEIEKIEKEADEVQTFMDQSTGDHALILEVLNEIHITMKMIMGRLDAVLNPIKEKKIIRKASPGFGFAKDVDKDIPKVVEYEKKNGEIGLKIKGDGVIFEDKVYKYLQECKYGCGNYISFDNYKKGQKALHITKDLVPIGRYCPKYGED